MIDIHTHILPGLDDGAESLDDTLAMAEQAVRSGVDVLVATPHSNQEQQYQNYESPALQTLFQQAKDALVRENIPLKLVRGMEIFASDDIVEKIRAGRLLPLNHSRYYLVEFAFPEEPWYIHDTLADLLEHGYIPVIAHPERYTCVQDDPNLLFEWRQMGVLAQLNKGSVLGRFGPRPERAAQQLLNHQLVNCIASDAHRPYIRTPDMREIDAFLCRYYSEEYRDLLLEENPSRIVFDRTPPAWPVPVPVERKKRWFL